MLGSLLLVPSVLQPVGPLTNSCEALLFFSVALRFAIAPAAKTWLAPAKLL
ncbi:hypothetical protein [Micromonospora ureilytica]|uniref:hypothetical protein n=1 Tax=Micromonospora ureilytica TaxID=709868 RepID=UPI00197B5E79|nr:hypothetical protein [Micromonospora ureilytica]